MFSDIIFLSLALMLYKLFNTANRTLAVLLVVFVGFSVFISYIGIQHKLDVVSLINRTGNNAFSHEQLQGQMMLYLDFYRNTIIWGEFFWGLWLLPLGLLIIFSRYIPYLIGILLLVGGLCYVTDFAATLMFPKYPLPNYVTMPASLGELGTCLWLLIAGVKRKAIAGE